MERSRLRLQTLRLSRHTLARSPHIRPLIGTTKVRDLSVVQNRDQASISCRRFWNKSPRRYAASTLLSIVCAKAISTTSRGKFVHSAAQSRNVDRNPWQVRSPRPIRLSTASIAMFESGLPRLPPANTNSCKRRSKNPSLKRPGCPVAPE